MKQLYHPKSKEIDAFIFKLNVAANTTIVLPFTNENSSTYSCWVDFGDHTPKKYINAYNDPDRSHLYVNAGIYTVRIAGKCQAFDIYNTGTIRDALIEIVEWGTKADFKRLRLYGCLNLTTIPNKPMTSVSNILSCQDMYRNCTNLKMNIPVGLFDNAVSSANFYGTFQGSGFTGSIPPYLFKYNVNVTANAFLSTFQGATGLTGTIPETLFETNTLVAANGFNQTFADTNLSGPIPYKLFWNNTLVSVNAFNRTFYSSELINGRVHPELFRYNILAQSFQETFAYTTVHGNIDPLLFSYAGASVLSFKGTFRNSNMGWDDASSPTEVLPATIWDTNINVTDFSETLYFTKFQCVIPLCFTQNTKTTTVNSHFQGTPFIGTIPVDLFVQMGASLLTVNSTFAGTWIQGIPNHLFWSNPNIWDFGSTFSSCDNIETGNNGLGYDPINNVLFSQNTKATNFGATFWDSENFAQSLPPDLWANNPLVTSVGQCFGKVQINYAVPSSIPVGIFANMPNLTNVAYFLYQGGYWMGNVQGEIPRDLFINNPLLVAAEWFIRWRGGVTRIPNGLFRNNKLLNNLHWFAYGSGNCKLEQYPFSESNSASAYERFRGCILADIGGAFQGATNGGRDYYMNLDVAPATDWEAEDIITGQTSGATCIVIAKISATQYEIKNNWGTWTLGEVVGVTGNANKLADQGTARPTITSGAQAGTSYAPELWDGTIYDMYGESGDLRPRPSTLWQIGDTIVGFTSGASFVMVSNQTTSAWTFLIKDLTGNFINGETVGVVGVPAKQIVLTYQVFSFSGRYIQINVSPVTDWARGDVITGQTSGATCVVLSKISATQYYIRGMVGTFTDGEVIGVTGDTNKLADQNAGAPTFVYAPNHSLCYNGGQNVMSNWAAIPADWK